MTDDLSAEIGVLKTKTANALLGAQMAVGAAKAAAASLERIEAALKQPHIKPSPPPTAPAPSFTVPYVRPKVACPMLACGMTRVYELLKNKELEAIKDGKNRLISVASINAYLERRKAGSE